MNVHIDHIVGLLNTTLHQTYQNKEPVDSLKDLQEENKITSHKFIIENNLIVYEKYDRYGKLISRVPWLPKTIDEKV